MNYIPNYHIRRFSVFFHIFFPLNDSIVKTFQEAGVLPNPLDERLNGFQLRQLFSIWSVSQAICKLMAN